MNTIELTQREKDLYSTMREIEQDSDLKEFMKEYLRGYISIADLIVPKDQGRLSEKYFIDKLHLSLTLDGFYGYVRLDQRTSGEHSKTLDDGLIYSLSFPQVPDVKKNLGDLMPELNAHMVRRSILRDTEQLYRNLSNAADDLKKEEEKLRAKMLPVGRLSVKYFGGTK